MNELMKGQRVKHIHSNVSISLTINFTNTIHFSKYAGNPLRILTCPLSIVSLGVCTHSYLSTTHVGTIYFHYYFEIQYIIFNFLFSVHLTYFSLGRPGLWWDHTVFVFLKGHCFITYF